MTKLSNAPASLSQKDKELEFENIKRRIHTKLVDKLDLSRVGELEGDVLRREIRLVVEHLCDTEDTYLNRNERDRLIGIAKRSAGRWNLSNRQRNHDRARTTCTSSGRPA
jgi:hypothetical protein